MGVQLDGPVGVGSEGGLGGHLLEQVLQLVLQLLLLLLLGSSLNLTCNERIRGVVVVEMAGLRLFMDPWWPRAIYLNMQTTNLLGI